MDGVGEGVPKQCQNAAEKGGSHPPTCFSVDYIYGIYVLLSDIFVCTIDVAWIYWSLTNHYNIILPCCSVRNNIGMGGPLSFWWRDGV